MAHQAKTRGAPTTSSRRAGLTTLGGQLAKATLQLSGLFVLSKLLTPRDFGIFALVTVVIALGDLLRDFGITQAALQSPDLSRQQASNLLWTMVGIGAFFAGATALLASPFADLFGHPELRNLAPWAGLAILINSTQPIYQVMLARGGRFLAIASTDVAAQAVGLLFAISLALAGAQHWALLAQVLTTSIVLATSRIMVARWRPCLPRRTKGMGPLYRYSANLGVAQVFGYAASNADTYSIGAQYSATSLGLYNRAFQLITVPTNLLLSPLTNVALPALSRARTKSTGEYRQLLAKAQLAVALPLCGAFAVAVAASPEILSVALGSQWVPASDIFAILSVAGMFQVLLFVSFWGFLASAQTRQLLYYNLLVKTCQIALIIWGASHSITAVAICYCVAAGISWPISLLWLRACDGIEVGPLMSNGALTLMAAATGIATAKAALRLVESQQDWVRLLTAGAAVLVVYSCALAFSPSVREFVVSAVVRQRITEGS